MLTFSPFSATSYRFSLALLVALCANTWALAQVPGKDVNSDVANLIRIDVDHSANKLEAATSSDAQTFDFSNNLIYFTAEVNGRRGNFILDTGAPEVLINDRGQATAVNAPVGKAAGGEVQLSDHFIESFVFTGKEHRKMWAYSLDLRPLEQRIGREVDGFVGHNLLADRELRIDYRKETFQLLTSAREPLHEGRAPDFRLPFKMSGHLPVITVRVGKRKLRLAIDTGASVNLLDPNWKQHTLETGDRINLQGLDGVPILSELVTLRRGHCLPGEDGPTKFALLNFNDLQRSDGDKGVHGILGSEYLSKFVVGIDYRRQRMYLWKPSLTK